MSTKEKKLYIQKCTYKQKTEKNMSQEKEGETCPAFTNLPEGHQCMLPPGTTTDHKQQLWVLQDTWHSPGIHRSNVLKILYGPSFPPKAETQNTFRVLAVPSPTYKMRISIISLAFALSYRQGGRATSADQTADGAHVGSGLALPIGWWGWFGSPSQTYDAVGIAKKLIITHHRDPSGLKM